MLNSISAPGRTPSFKAVILKKTEVPKLPESMQKMFEPDSTFEVNTKNQGIFELEIISKIIKTNKEKMLLFNVEDGKGQATVDKNKPLDDYLIIKNELESKKAKNKNEKYLMQLLHIITKESLTSFVNDYNIFCVKEREDIRQSTEETIQNAVISMFSKV